MDKAVQALMVQVGDRVRSTRERKGISRRELSEKSGVSPRYLAQLETGEGNISIGLLTRIAIALDHRIEWFVGEDDPWTSNTIRMADLFRHADSDTQAKVMQVLTPLAAEEQRASRICLVGLRGAGKTTLGKAISSALDVQFVELNQEIEKLGGMPVAEIMALYGQEGYRKLESDAVDSVAAQHERIVLAVAGGIVSEPATFSSLLARFHTVWIKASAQEHMDRVRAQGDERPMKGNPEAMAQLQTILQSRESLYGQASLHLDTSGVAEKTSVAELLKLIKSHELIT